jgi:hypothetical protein
VCVEDDNVERLERESCETILREMREEDEARRAKEPGRAERAARYADGGNPRLYAWRDAEWKWREAYRREQGVSAPDACLGGPGTRVVWK